MVTYYNSIVQESIRSVADLAFHMYFKMSISGKENLSKPAIMAFNHVHALDPFIIASQLGQLRYAMAKKELFNPLSRGVMRMMGAYPINTKPRNQKYSELAKNYFLLLPKNKRLALLEDINRYVLAAERLKGFNDLDHRLFTEYILLRGESLLVHLPGKRTKDYEKIQRPKIGAAQKALEIMDKHGRSIDIIPGGIVYSKAGLPIIGKLPFRSRVDISTGPPLNPREHYDDYRKDRQKAVAELTELVNDGVDAQVKGLLSGLQDTHN